MSETDNFDTTVTFYVTARFNQEMLERIKGQEISLSAGIVSDVMNALDEKWKKPCVSDVEIDSIRAGDVIVWGSHRRGET